MFMVACNPPVNSKQMLLYQQLFNTVAYSKPQSKDYCLAFKLRIKSEEINNCRVTCLIR
uniref:Uncharacterized protein n=1 Tax=Arundo donax TaxID=35708 RepID=A0A0A9HDV8_ARUDO